MAKVGEVVAKPLNLDDILGKPKNRVARVGIELEGAWNPAPVGVKIERDSSVFHDHGDDGNIGRTLLPGWKVGEVPIGRIQPAQVKAALKKYYPQKIDKSCGMHVHLGFESMIHYSYLMEPEYQATVLEYLARWARGEGLSATHPIWNRLAGGDMYCQPKFWPDEQVRNIRKDYDKTRVGHRYTILNYAYGRYKTIECRVLPMMETPEQAFKVIKVLLDITNASLLKLKGKVMEKHTVQGFIDDYQEFIQEVI